MKARVKATGEIIEVKVCDNQFADYIGKNGLLYWKGEIDFEVTDKDVIYNKGWQDGWDEAVKSEIPKIPPRLKGSEPDYWEKLKHQAAINIYCSYVAENGAEWSANQAIEEATALVEKLKNDSNEERR